MILVTRLKKAKDVPNTLRQIPDGIWRASKKASRFLRKQKSVLLRTRQVRTVKRWAKMEAHKALRLFFKFLHLQVSIRPRIRLVCAVVLVLMLTFVLSAKAADKLHSKEADIKVNGQAILVADRTNAQNEPVSQIEAVVGSVRSPFDFTRPAGGYISQGYTFYHRAVDITGEYGSEIRPLGSGKVIFAGYMADGHGNTVIVDHENGMKSSYAHMSKISVGVGNEVPAGSTIGYIGLTGHTTGPHVHVEVEDNGIFVDPAKLLP